MAAAILIFACPGTSTADLPGERPPAAAGTFYPGDAGALGRAVDLYLEDAVRRPVDDPVALIVPHAGYLYSGQIAADGFRQLAGMSFSTVVVLGTNHTTAPFPGGSVWYAGSYRTPLGEVPVDVGLAKELMDADRRFVFRMETHGKEHSIEVELPFIQKLFPEAKIVPVIVGSSEIDLCRDLGRALAERLRGRKALIVASSDLSHYPARKDAEVVDRQFLRAVATLDPEEVRRAARDEMALGVPGLSTCACGEAPILTALFAAKELSAKRAVAVSYANSGETAVGDEGRVVGYGAMILARGAGESDVAALEEPAPAKGGSPLTEEEKDYLHHLARRTIEQYLTTGTAPLPRPDDPALRAGKGAFVTLYKGGALRGCIGHIVGNRPLCRTVASAALQAAFHDRRFPPLELSEWKEIAIEVSVLTPFRRVERPEEIEIGRHGVAIRKGGHSAVYLPKVAVEQGWDREETLDRLCRKGGLPAGSWREGAEIYVFEADAFGEGKSN